MKASGKNIVITGGTSGIGYELVRALQSDNRVFVIASNEARLARLSSEFPSIETCRADLSDPADVESAAERALDCFSTIDILINNAAVQHTPTLLDDAFDVQTIGPEIGVNFTAVCTLTALLLPAMMHGGEAAVVNVNSALGLMPKTRSAVYCATKAAVNVFSQSLRYQLEGTNVRVMQAFMPLVDTQMTNGRGDGKISPSEAARALLDGVDRDIEENDIGKVKIVRLLIRFAPPLARRILRAA